MKVHKHRVQYYETDKMGITHHSNYIRWMEEARVEFLDQIGWSYKALEDSGIMSPVIAVECSYKETTTFSDIIDIDVTIEEFKGIRLKLRYTMHNQDGTLVCEGSSQHCFMDTSGHLLQIKKSHPAFYQALLEQMK